MKRLLDVLREDLHLTGTKEGCGEGECGSCSVRMNGELVNSCLVPVLQAEGAEFRPSKGWRAIGELHPLQQAFLECGGAQCGICTPGMLMAAAQLLAHQSASQPSLKFAKASPAIFADAPASCASSSRCSRPQPQGRTRSSAARQHHAR